MKYTNLTFTTRQENEHLHREAMDAKAIENGFDKFSRYDFDQYWPKQDGTVVMEGFYQKGNNRLHVTCINPYKKEQADARNYQLSINHD
jgi:hypothetical protein